MLKKYLVLFIVCSCLFSTRYAHAQSWVSVGSPGFSGTEADNGTLAIDSNGTPYVAFVDLGTPLFQATVMKYDGTSWVPVGHRGFTAGQVQYTSISIDHNNVPYVAYMDINTLGFRASVMKFMDTGWVAVGDTGFSQQQASSICMAIDTAGTPFVAYLDDFGCLGLPTVMKYNGTSWVNVGAPRFDTGNVAYISMAIAGSTPYVAFPDGFDTQKATVMKLVDTTWMPVGNRGFSAQGIGPISLVMSKDTPYVAFTDYANSRKATVMKYDGSNWVTVGIAGFTAGEADYISLAIDNHGNPYVFYEDPTTPHLGATAMKYNGSSWVGVGMSGFTTGLDAVNTMMAIDKNGTPYACYQQFPGATASVMKFDATTDVKSVAAAGSSLSVFPNPASTQITVSASFPINEIVITDLLGQTVYSVKYSGGLQVSVDVAELPKGVYLVRVNPSAGSGQAVVRKFVKE